MRHLSHAVPKVAGQAFARKYIMLGRLVTHWSEIVGTELALKTQPVKTRYAKVGGKPHISLDIAASSADATLLLYRKDLIIERINQLFGDTWISAIRFVPTSSNTSQPRRKPALPLTADEKNYLSNVVSQVEDTELQASLESLGKAIMQDVRCRRT